jgi:hypothetical protein
MTSPRPGFHIQLALSHSASKPIQVAFKLPRTRTTLMAKSPLLSFALVFAAGFGFGFMYHHIASLAHEAIASESGDSLLPRLRSVEARLAALEAAKATAILPVLAN